MVNRRGGVPHTPEKSDDSFGLWSRKHIKKIRIDEWLKI